MGRNGGAALALLGVVLFFGAVPAQARPRAPARRDERVLPIVPAAGVLDGGILSALVSRVSAYRAKDAFDSAPQFPEAAGRQFRLITPIDSHYDDRTRLLTISAYAGLDDAELGGIVGWQSRLSFGYIFRQNMHSIGDRLEANAFGSTTTVERARGQLFAVAEFVGHDQVLPRFGQRFGIGPAVDKTVVATPDEARSLVRKFHAVVEGYVRPLADGSSATCGVVTNGGPTLDNPFDRSISTCVIPVEFTRIAIENTETGEVVAEWREAPR